MLRILIENQEYTEFNSFSIDLNFDSVASGFAFDFYFNPQNGSHRQILKPGKYPNIQVLYESEVLATGYVISPNFQSSSEPSLVSIDCYSKTGILEDVNPSLGVFPLEFQKQTLKAVAQKLIQSFGINLVVDSIVSDKAQKKYEKVDAGETESVKKILANLASQRGIVLTHNEFGDLVLTKAQTNQEPIAFLDESQPGVEFDLSFDGQQMHTPITVMGQQSPDGGNASEATVDNPLVKKKRPKTISQSSGDNTDANEAAKNARSDELRNLELSIGVDRWKLNSQIIKPNKIVRVESDRLFIRSPIDFFIKSVSLKGGVEPETAELKCVLPEVYTGEKPADVFS